MYARYVTDDSWLVVEKDLDKRKLRFWETLFTLGNGYLGSRGILEEGCEGGYAGTYLAGVHDRSEAESFEIVNAPNPLTLEIYCNGTKLGSDEMEVVEHRRFLNLKKGLLLRRTLFRDRSGHRYEYESLRFFSLADVHLGWIRAHLRSLDCDVEVVVRSTIDGSTKNEFRPDERSIKHYSVINAGTEKGGLSYMLVKTDDLGISIGFGTALDILVKGKAVKNSGSQSYASREVTRREVFFKALKGVRYRIDKIISVHSSREPDIKGLKNRCTKDVRSAKVQGMGSILRDHVRAWDRIWRDSGIRIVGDEDVQRALRFDIYQLTIAAPPEGVDASIPAKALSGEWYGGHVFWDTEIYTLPFFVYTRPRVARALLLYRYQRLDKARKGASIQGYSGSLWPWESALRGDDETPETWIDFNGTKIPVHNKEREHHIASDVIQGLSRYYQATGDEYFMLRYGAEMVFETARFWASRVTCDKRSGRYEIKDVIGPNEFQRCVNNNSYTNVLARWVLRYASKLHSHLSERHPRKLKALTRKIGLEEMEVDAWREISEKIVFLTRPDGLIEEFEGYFNREDVTIDGWDESGMPIWPSRVKLAKVSETQLVKQADVILFLHLLSGEFSLDAKRINYEYYERRTTHKSSLSIPSYALIALEVGDVEKGYKYFTQALDTDLSDVYHNTELGIHIGALGGAWQILAHGFAGVRIRDDVLHVDPILPRGWKSMRFRMWFRGTKIEFSLREDGTKASMIKGKKSVAVEIYGKRLSLSRRRKIDIKKE